MKEILTVKTDLTVVGAGYAGICTALAAARNGIRVALVNDRIVPGGNASSEHRVAICGATTGNHSYYSREAGIADEIKLTLYRYNNRYADLEENHLNDMTLTGLLSAEPNLRYFPGTVVYDCETEEGKIISADGFCAGTQKHYRFESPFFCDASGDAVLSEKAGATCRVGREARSEYGESLAPETADRHVMGSAILYSVKDSRKPVPFVRPEGVYDFRKDDKYKWFDRPETGRELPGPGGPYNTMWWLSYGGLSDTVRDAGEIDCELRKLVYSFWDYVKNSGEYPDAENLSLEWVAPYASKRESRRVLGDYTLTQPDIQSCRVFDDEVSHGGWTLDIHDVAGIYGKEPVSAFGEVRSIYGIPFSILYAKEIGNLFLAGRLVSCSHVALGSLRVQETLGAMGQAAGTAAALCCRYHCSPRTLREEHLAELQDTLQRNGQYLPNRDEDVGLAGKAKITASGEKPFENMLFAGELPLYGGVTVCLPVPKNGSLPASVTLYLKNRTGEAIVCPYRVLDEESPSNYYPGRELLAASVTLPADWNGGVRFPLPETKGKERIYLQLPYNQNLSVRHSGNVLTGSPAFDAYGNRFRDGTQEVTPCFAFEEKVFGLYAPANVINGRPRPKVRPNLWMSDRKEGAFLRLEWEEPVDTETVSLYFDAQTETEVIRRPPAQLITDFRITAKHRDGIWTKEIRNGWLSQYSLPMPLKGVTEVTVEPLRNNGYPYYEILSLKIF